MMRRRFAFALWSLMPLVACSPASEEEEVGSDLAEWGHVNTGLTPRAPQFLINKQRGEGMRACLPTYMTQMFPGIREELTAAVNVWARYLGRSIDVEYEIVDLPRARADQTPETLSALYNQRCGAGYDVVLGLAPLRGSVVGKTGFVTTLNRDRSVKSFRRYLFLRDFDVTPQTVDGVRTSWVSLEDRTGNTTDSARLLTRMLARNQVSFAENGASLTLPTIVHEVGHVWGMCDQYENGPGCDRRNSTSHPVLDSVMGRMSVREKIYLTD